MIIKWGAQCWAQYSGYSLTSAKQREGSPFFNLLAILILIQLRISLVTFVASEHCRLMVNLVSTKTSRSFSAKLLYCQLSAFIRAGGCSFPVAGLHFPLLNFMKFLLAYFFRLLHTSGWQCDPVLNQLFLPVLSVKLLRLDTCLIIHIINEDAEPEAYSSIDLWGMPLAASLQLDFVPPVTALWTWLFSQFSVYQCPSSPYFISFSISILGENRVKRLPEVQVENILCLSLVYQALLIPVQIYLHLKTVAPKILFYTSGL